jgi:ubiquinone/menaquinone biosynthesis C-methylase UbiE
MPASLPPRPTALAHLLLRQAIRAGELVIDATAGNGHDTLFLAERVGPAGRVLAFDVQAAAIAAARVRVAAQGWQDRVTFQQQSHALLEDHAAAGTVAAVMFNLGYLPGNSHGVITGTDSTLKGLAGAATVLKPGGVLAVVCYPGHAGGEVEAVAVEAWFVAQVAEGWRVAKYGVLATRRPAPFLLLGTKPQ